MRRLHTAQPTRVPWALLLLLSLAQAQAAVEDPTVGRVPPKLRKSWNLDDFYVKHLDVLGIPILASEKVSDEALLAARALALRMLEHRPELARKLTKARIRIGIIGAQEKATDIPEHRDLNDAFPQTDWDQRTRGVGATSVRPASTVGEENLTGLEGDRYRGESIFIHEFAHTLHQQAIVRIDGRFDRKLQEAYEAAMKKGLWKDTYAATDRVEYWAEGVQSWFDANTESVPANGVHNEIDTREELRAYDPGLAALITEWFGEDEWRYQYPRRKS